MADIHLDVPPPLQPVPPSPSWRAMNWKLNGTITGLALVVGVLVAGYWKGRSPSVDPAPNPVPVIVDPAAIAITVPVKKMSVIKLPTLPEGTKVLWFNPEPEKLQDLQYPDHASICPQVSGQLYLAADTFLNGSFRRISWAITANEGAKPPPIDPDPVDPVPPTPKPPTPPDPKPIDPVIKQAEKVAVVIVEDTLKRTPAQGKVMMDPTLRAKLAADGHRVIQFSTADPTYKSHGYDPYIQAAGGLPSVLVFDLAKIGTNSAPLVVFPLPATAAELQTDIYKAVKK